MMNSVSSAAAFPSHSYYCGSASGVLSAGAANAVSGGWPSAAPPQNNGLPTVFDYYGAPTLPDYYGYNTASTSMSARYDNASGSTGTPSPHSFENSCWGNPASEQLYSQLTGSSLYAPYHHQPGTKKRGGTNSKKERRRTISINGAFSNLRDCIPNVPKDTKLSKIKTLKLACGYIQHLMDALESETPQSIEEFKADLSRKTPCRAEKRKCIEAEIVVTLSAKGNKPHIVDDTFTVYDWSSFLSGYMRAMPSILKYHQMVMKQDTVTAVRHLNDSEQHVFKLLKATAPEGMPPRMPLKGLDPARQWYLYESIREFCRYGTEDLVAPQPSITKPDKSAKARAKMPAAENEPQTKKKGRKRKGE